MRLVAVGGLLVALLSGACRQGESVAPAKYDGEEGFQATRWGMTPAEVMRAHPDCFRWTTQHHDPTFTCSVMRVTEIAARKAEVTFCFRQDRLAQVYVKFGEADEPRIETVQARESGLEVLRDRLKPLLSEKYGPPIASDEGWSNQWRTQRTIIQMFKGSSWGGGYEHSVLDILYARIDTPEESAGERQATKSQL